jgi:hypothetical protein
MALRSSFNVRDESLQFSASDPAMDGMKDPLGTTRLSRRNKSTPPPERTVGRIPGLSVLHLLLPLGSVAAQLCAGRQSFAGRPVQLWGFGTFTNGSHLGSYGGGLRLIGGRAAFGDVELGASHTDAYGGHSWLLGTAAAYQVSVNKKGTVQLCPVASVGFVLGPKNSYGSGQDFSETDAAAGASIGVLASHSAQIDVVPTASVVFEHTNQKFKDTRTGTTTSTSVSFELIELGLGLVHRHQLTLKPSLAIPVGLSGAGTYFTVALAYSVGTPQ